MNIAILDDYQDAVRKLPCMQHLQGYTVKVYTNNVKGVGQLAIRLRDADVVVLLGERTHISGLLISKLPKLRLIAQVGKVGPHIDLNACTQRGITVTQSGEDPNAAAELAWTLVMASMRRLPQYIANLKHGTWQQSGFKAAAMPPNFALGSSLRGKTLGIWGYGQVGKIVASYGKAFGMHVLVWGSSAARTQAIEDGIATASDKTSFFSASDVLSLHLRFAPSTRFCVTKQDLAQMKPTALLVNTAHAELLQPDALLHGLQQGRPGLAAVDVYESEPILQGHGLLRLENCICTPHIGYVEQDSYERLLGETFDSIKKFAQSDT